MEPPRVLEAKEQERQNGKVEKIEYFIQLKKKSPGIQNTRIQSDIKADVHLMNMEAGTKWQVAAKESHPFAFLLIQP